MLRCEIVKVNEKSNFLNLFVTRKGGKLYKVIEMLIYIVIVRSMFGFSQIPKRAGFIKTHF